MTRGIFVTGTDTGVGKTMVAVALLRALVDEGHAAAGMKPFAAGIDVGETINADVRCLLSASNVVAPFADVNPYAYAQPIAPHLAAAECGSSIDLDVVAAAYTRLSRVAEVVVVEGAGGLLVPLGDGADMLDVPARLRLPVLLVVGIRLGCLNHALLSSLALEVRGVRFAGWVANRIDDGMDHGDENVKTLVDLLPAPLLADIGWNPLAGSANPFGRAALQQLGFTQPRGA